MNLPKLPSVHELLENPTLSALLKRFLLIGVSFCLVATASIAARVTFGSEPVAAPMWPLGVAENGRFFVDQSGKPYFPIIDTVWMLSYLKQADVDLYLAQRPLKGFNAVYVSLIGVEDLVNRANYAGHRPFAEKSGSLDTTQPDAAFFEDFKTTMHKLRDHGITVFLTVGWAAAWQASFTHDSYRRYVELLLDQYPRKSFPNIVWCLGGDRGMVMQKDLDKQMQIEAGRRLRQLMDARGDRRLIGEHPGRGSSVINYSTEEAAGWLDFYTVQSGHRPPSHDVPDWMRQAYERQPVKPVFNGEPLYESHNLGLENAEVRWAHWVSVFSGACAVSYGCQGFWGIGIDVPARGRRPSRASDWWKQHLDDQPVANQVSCFATLNREYPFHQAVPDYATEHPLIAEHGLAGNYKAALLARDKSWALVYLPNGKQAASVGIAMERFASPISARWFDPTSGTFTETGKPVANSGTRAFEAPMRNRAKQWDWVLVLDARKALPDN